MPPESHVRSFFPSFATSRRQDGLLLRWQDSGEEVGVFSTQEQGFCFFYTPRSLDTASLVDPPYLRDNAFNSHSALDEGSYRLQLNDRSRLLVLYSSSGGRSRTQIARALNPSVPLKVCGVCMSVGVSLRLGDGFLGLMSEAAVRLR